MYSLQLEKSLYCRKLLKRLIYVLLCALAMLSCSKENRDTTPPIINLSSPTAGHIFYYQNTIPVRALVSDETHLESVSVEITSTYNTRVYAPHDFSPTHKDLQVDLSISHDDLYLPSGTYHVKITASDGNNTHYAFQEIQLIEAPRTLDRTIIIRSNAGTTAIDSLSNNSLTPWLSFAGNYAFGGIDSRTNQLVACSASPSELSSLSYPDLESLLTPFPTTPNELTAFHHDKVQHQFIWGNSIGQLLITDLTSSRLFSYVNASNRIKCITTSREHIIAISEAATGSTNYIDVYPRSNGIPLLTLSVDWEITGVIPLPSDEHFFILAGNSSGQAHFAYLNLNTGAINENFNFYDQSSVSSIIAADGDDFYTIQSNGVVRYINNFSSFSLNDTQHPDKLIFDELNHALWTIDNVGIHQFNEALTNETANIPISGVSDLWLKYNK